MKPIHFVLFISLLFTASVGAQAQIKRLPAAVSRGGRAPLGSVSRTLRERVNTSYQKALETQKKYPDLFVNDAIDSGPSASLFPRGVYHPAQRLYPNAPFLKHSPKNLANYFLASENRHIIRLAPQLDALQQSWEENIANFQQAQLHWTGAQEQDMHWLVTQQIPRSTSYLLVGEHHNEPNIYHKVAQLLRELRLQQPEREIVLLTEYYPTSDALKAILPKTILPKELAQVRQAATENNISIVGLEPSFSIPDSFDRMRYTTVHRNKNSMTYSYHEELQNIWVSLEGMRLRNASWLTTIEQYRQQHPDALFIVYGGDGHIRGSA
ncbi:MAG: hypothetical protein MJ053_06960, partial [Elusimicrobiaceae bacterium]|nr:hypothetical protein [Elusimicrobiaceae bacterium]